MAAVAHFPGFDKGRLDRARRPLAVAASLLLVVDLIGLGMHLADKVQNPFANDATSGIRARIGGVETIVPGASGADAPTPSNAAEQPRAAQPLGCLAVTAACYTPPNSPNSNSSNSPNNNGATPPPNTPGGEQPVPAAQAVVGVPALGVQVSVGAGDGSCTGASLTVLPLSDCPPPASSDGPVAVELGGSLLGD